MSHEKWGETKQHPNRASSRHQLNKILSGILFMSMAICFIMQTFTQVEKFCLGKVVQSADTYIPGIVQLPTLIVCREKTATIDRSLLEQKGLPKNMFSGLPLDLNVVNTMPFPNLQETWDTVTMNLTVEGKTQYIHSELVVSELNTAYQGRCYKIDSKKSFPGGTRVFSEFKFKTVNKDIGAYNVFFGYNVNVAGVVSDYMPVPYKVTLINNRTYLFMQIG